MVNYVNGTRRGVFSYSSFSFQLCTAHLSVIHCSVCVVRRALKDSSEDDSAAG